MRAASVLNRDQHGWAVAGAAAALGHVPVRSGCGRLHPTPCAAASRRSESVQGTAARSSCYTPAAHATPTSTWPPSLRSFRNSSAPPRFHGPLLAQWVCLFVAWRRRRVGARRPAGPLPSSRSCASVLDRSLWPRSSSCRLEAPPLPSLGRRATPHELCEILWATLWRHAGAWPAPPLAPTDGLLNPCSPGPLGPPSSATGCRRRSARSRRASSPQPRAV